MKRENTEYRCTFEVDYDGYEYPCMLEKLECSCCPWGEEECEEDEHLSTWAGEKIPTLRDDICAIILEGEDTIIGRQVTISRIQDILRYKEWLEEDNEEI